ncbi:hypothetical protein ACS0TY_025673 [Phlomoides rotata]
MRSASRHRASSEITSAMPPLFFRPLQESINDVHESNHQILIPENSNIDGKHPLV